MDLIKLCKIRFTQLTHHLRNLGVIYLAALILLLVFVLGVIYNQISDVKSAWITILLVCIVISQFHFSRKDSWFVRAHVLKPELNMFAEYILYTFPVQIILIVKGFYLQSLLLIISLSVISFIQLRFDLKQQNYYFLKFIPDYLFEWKSGLKKVYYPILLLLFLSLALSGFRIISLFIIWIISMMLSGFYNENESLQILFNSGINAKKILSNKIIKALNLFYLISLPSLLLNVVFNPTDWWLVLLFIITQTVFILFIICLKYATYEPNKKYAANGVLLGLAQLSVVIPFLLPVPLFLGVRYYFKSIKNLNYYT